MSAAFWRGFFDVLTMRALFSPPPKYSVGDAWVTVGENLRKAMCDFEAGLTPEQRAKLASARKSPGTER